MVTVSIILRKDRVNSKGEAPLYFRITKNRKPTYISSNIRLKPALWDDKNKRIKSGFSNSARFNAQLAAHYSTLQATILDLDKENKALSAKTLKGKVNDTGEKCFHRMAEELTAQSIVQGNIGTADKNKAIINKLNAFSPTLSFNQITVAFLAQYESHLRTVHHNTTNTIHTNLKFIRRVVNEACTRDIISITENAFLKFKIKTQKTSKSYLTESELNLIQALSLEPGSKLDVHRKMFLFGVYSGGLRVSDLLLLKWSEFDGSHIHVTIRKTNTQHSIKISEKASTILLELKKSASADSRYVFNQVCNDLNESNPREIDLSISRATAQYNKNLRTLGKLAGISKPISSHTARHSFGCLAIKKGMPLYHLQHIMKHSSPMITQQYAKIVNEDLDKAMQLLN